MAEQVASWHSALSTSGQQRADLKRMRRLATGLLALMVALYLLANFLRARWPWLDYPRAFAEAAIVGACADWFAVEALFRRPLGLPIPHTAIILNQQRKIGDAVGRFVKENFLATQDVHARVEGMDAAGWLANWLRNPDNVKGVVARSKGATPTLLELLQEDRLRTFCRSIIVGGVDSIQLAPLCARTLSALLGQGHFDRTFDLTVEMARKFLETHRESIRERVVKNKVKWITGWINARLADAILDELLSELAQAQSDLSHPWRLQCRNAIIRLETRLEEDPQLLDQMERIKRQVLSQDVVEGYVDQLIAETETTLRAELSAQDGRLSAGFERALSALGAWLAGDAHIRATINSGWRRLVLTSVIAGRDEIGAFVAGVVNRWDAKTLVERLELQVGKDLQFIRVNGTVVGGLVGLMIFTVSRLFA